MDDYEGFLAGELERLAQAATLSTSSLPPASELMDTLGISDEVASTVISTQRSMLSADKASSAEEATALVTVPADHPADFLFRLDPPVDTTAKLEQALGLPTGMLQSVKASRLGSGMDEEGAEEVEFCFVNVELRDMILAWVEKEGKGFKPMWVKLAKV